MADDLLPDADLVLDLPGTNRCLAADLVGDEGAPAVLYLHGTPDSRLARHPDPAATQAAGVRLIAVDRPGFGMSTFDPAGTPTSFAADLRVLVEYLGLDHFNVLGWSAGCVWALAVGALLPDVIGDITIVGGLVPVEACKDPEVRAVAGDARLAMWETATDLGAATAGRMIGPLLAPHPATLESALEHRRAAQAAPYPRGESSQDHTESIDEVASVPGAERQMALALCDAVRHGTAGLIHDVQVQFSPLDFSLADVLAPTRLIHGENDTTCPPQYGRWLAEQLPHATVTVMDNAGHALLLPHWTEILRSSTHLTHRENLLDDGPEGIGTPRG